MASLDMPLGATAGATATTDTASGKSRLAKAAIEFEAVLLGQWLDGAEHSFGTVPGSEEDEDAGGEQMRSFGTQSLAHALAARDTLGIARLVEHGLEKAASWSVTSPQPPSAAEGALGAKLPSNL